MSEETQNHELDPEDLRTAVAVRTLSRPVASEAFRVELRNQFTSGAFAEKPPVSSRSRSKSPRRWMALVPLAAAAALLFLLGPVNRGPGLDIASVRGAEEIMLDGKLVPCSDLSPIQAALHPGCRLVVPEGATVELASTDRLMVELQGGEFTFPKAAHRWFGGKLDSRVDGDGTLRMATGKAFSNSSYSLHVGDTEFIVSGTVFTLRRDGANIGVDVLEGELEARMPDGRSEIIRSGTGARIQDGRLWPSPMDPAEAEALRTLQHRRDEAFVS